ncbi:glyoxalase/bleomycin resistance/dioxygenase family protein [Bacillus timonensis]|uniref:Glyoxalase/bleomycin resistance/dioxygenase family protein n=1 Tax=Bacillus timonensis TaxID=1033734 RepID=A0A4S3PR05_9BACI|nr:VOC family protein [Bacillus timonensis]THE12097.1 glyoxalase/bleomycin resistance/dioxygenase family protein [Bacillus timonensis]
MRIHHYGLEVRNLEDSVTFYKDDLGFTEETRFVFMEEEIVFLTLGEIRLELIASHTLNTHICFEVSNLDSIMPSLTSLRKVEGPYQFDNGWQTVFFEGPSKEILEFLQIIKNQKSENLK